MYKSPEAGIGNATRCRKGANPLRMHTGAYGCQGMKPSRFLLSDPFSRPRSNCAKWSVYNGFDNSAGNETPRTAESSEVREDE